MHRSVPRPAVFIDPTGGADPRPAAPRARSTGRAARRRLRSLLVLIALAAVAVSCDGGGDGDNGSAATGAGAPGGSAGSASAAAAADGGPALAPEEVYRRVAPSIAFVSTPFSTGSAVQIDARHLLTNAHVVWPAETVRIVYPDGTEFPAATVVGVDLLLDVAVVALPDDAPVPALPTGAAAAVPPGAAVYLIGYPAESEAFPQPAITGGIVSRVRRWDAASLAYIQTDATIAHGQSGGALVAADGRVIGLSGFSFSEAAFGLVADIEPTLAAAAALIAGEAPATGVRGLAAGGAAAEQRMTLAHFYDERAFLFAGTAGEEYVLRAASARDADLYIAVLAPDGTEVAYADETIDGDEEVTAFTAVDGPYLVVIGQFADEPTAVTLAATVPLRPLLDPEDERVLAAGDAVGALDYPGDYDAFTLDLQAGETVAITVSSPNIDAFLSVEPAGPAIGAAARAADWPVLDDDSGGGVFGLDARLTVTADWPGRYRVVVSDAAGGAMGGYVVRLAPPGPATPGVPTAPDTPKPDRPAS